MGILTRFIFCKSLGVSFATATGDYTNNPLMVGIELGRVCGRQRATTLALSVARWVHNSAMATFPEAPL